MHAQGLGGWGVGSVLGGGGGGGGGGGRGGGGYGAGIYCPLALQPLWVFIITVLLTNLDARSPSCCCLFGAL